MKTTRLTMLALVAALAAYLWGSAPRSGAETPTSAAARGAAYDIDAAGSWQGFEKPAPGELRAALGELEYDVTQEDGTERAFHNRYWDHHESGLYVDVVSGEPLFVSLDKFDSGTGWPSFTRPVVTEHVTEHVDTKYGMRRVEVRSKHADSHLGHLFEDGPAPTGLRYCINSAALRFVPAGELETEGYAAFASLFETNEGGAMEESMSQKRTETATLAGGCFWGMEDIIRDIPGVLDTEVGYTGGHVAAATYEVVKTGSSGHAESIRVSFDPDALSYAELLGWFFRLHDPTTKNRQGNDIGTQYRSAIFFHDDAQRETAERVKAEVDASGKWRDPIVTAIVAAGDFHDAEDYHQDYLEKHPNGYTCHFLRD